MEKDATKYPKLFRRKIVAFVLLNLDIKIIVINSLQFVRNKLQYF